jgi:uncharacterized phage protein (TIGR02218 family)
MKTASTAVKAILSTGQFWMADLLTITPVYGSVIYITNADTDLSVNGHTFIHNGLIFERGATALKIGLEVDTMALTLKAGQSVLLNGIPAMQTISNGYLDGASVRLDRAVSPSQGQAITGTFWMFSGHVADMTVTALQASMTVKSWLDLLNVQYPKNVFAPPCQNMLFDSSCGLLASAYRVSGAALSGSLASSVIVSRPGGVSGYFDLGTLAFTSGPNAGQTLMIRSSIQSGSNVTIVPVIPFLHDPGIGDTLTLLPGCDKAAATCTGKFSNTVHFKGCSGMASTNWGASA